MNPALVGLFSMVIFAIGLVGLRQARTAPASLRTLTSGASQRRQSPVSGVHRLAGRLFGPFILRRTNPRSRQRQEHWLDAAGRPDRVVLADVAAARAGDTLVCLVIGGVAIIALPIWLLPLIAVYGFFRQSLQWRRKAKARQTRIERDLPDYLDVLGVTIQAGLKFRGALRRVGERFESPVSEEFRIALQQMEVGSSRRAAFEGVRERNDSPSLNRFVGALLQAEELGAPLTDSMIAISSDMRKTFGQNARKQAARATPKVTLVATTLLLPASALLLIGGLVIGGDLDIGGVLGG
ncbi:MAG: type II secretion system F family protein [Euzebya sp.]